MSFPARLIYELMVRTWGFPIFHAKTQHRKWQGYMLSNDKTCAWDWTQVCYISFFSVTLEISAKRVTYWSSKWYLYSILAVVRRGSPWTRSVVGVCGQGVSVFGLPWPRRARDTNFIFECWKYLPGVVQAASMSIIYYCLFIKLLG